MSHYYYDHDMNTLLKDYACFQVRDFRLLFLHFEVDRELQSCGQRTNLLDCSSFILRLTGSSGPVTNQLTFLTAFPLF